MSISLELPLPPAPLQSHVFSRDVTSTEYLEAGDLCARSLERTLRTHGLTTAGFKRVLDFGCGSARVLRHFAPLFSQVEFHGSDVAESVVAWNRANIPGAVFNRNDAEPPLPFADGHFDYLWSISVFSHLPERMALAWLGELRRVLKQGGIALVTVHGPFRFREDCDRGCITEDARAEYENDGFTYVHAFDDGMLPEWYQNAFVKESYVRRVYSRYFEILDYVPRGMMGRQDIVLMRRP